MKVKICIGSACHLKGSYNVIHELQALVEEYALGGQVEITAVFCLGHCTKAVSVQVNEEAIDTVSSKTAREFFLNRDRKSTRLNSSHV